jgi:uncharacterized protein YukE
MPMDRVNGGLVVEPVRVDPAALRQLGSTLEDGAEDLATLLSEFTKLADDIADGFGVLTESEETLAAYQDTLEDTSKGVRDVRDVLGELAGGLRDCARAYVQADGSNAGAVNEARRGLG